MNELTIALVNEQMNGQTNERTNECTNEWSNELSDRCSDKRIVWWTGERTVGQMLGRTNHRMFKWMNEQLMIERTITWIIVLYILGNKCGICLYTTWPVTTSLRHVFQHWLSHYVPYLDSIQVANTDPQKCTLNVNKTGT